MLGAMDDHAPSARVLCRCHGLSLQANRLCNLVSEQSKDKRLSAVKTAIRTDVPYLSI